MSSEFSAILPTQTRCGLKLGERAPCDLFHGFSSSTLYQSSSHTETCLELLNRSASPKRKKRKSRKHQRVLGHRAVLEQQKQLGAKKETNSSTPLEGTNKSTMLEEASWCCQSNCRCPTASRSSHVILDQHRIRLTKLKKALSDSLSEPCSRTNEQHASIRGYDSGLSLPGSSTSSRPSSPCQPGTLASKCVAIDCEMVGTGAGGKVSELARCSIVNYTGDIIYDKYIMPVMPVYDYRTRWSGITKQHMKGAIPFAVAQKEIIAILKDKLVIGHAIYHDFRALKYYHPSSQTRDTSKFALLNQKAGLPVKATVSLKSLACNLLHKNIQVGREGHSSVEDAFTAMELYRLVQDEWEKEIQTRMWPSLPSQPSGDLSDNERFMDDKYWPEDLNVHYT